MDKHYVALLPAHEKLKASFATMRALAHPLRLEILHLIDKHKEMNVGDIYTTLKIEQALASQQLRILRMSDLVRTRRDQKFIYYRLNYEKIQKAAKKSSVLSEMT